MVVRAHHPSYSGDQCRKLNIQGQPGQLLQEFVSKQKVTKELEMKHSGIVADRKPSVSETLHSIYITDKHT